MRRHSAPARLVLGGWMLLGGINHFTGQIVREPRGTRALAVQLMQALESSGLLDVAFGIMLAAGVLLLARRVVPLALAALLPVNIGAAYWALVLEHDPLWGALALASVVLGAGLMLLRLPAYHAMLEPRPLAMGETPGQRYESTYATPRGGIGPGAFALAMAPVLGAAVFFHLLLPPIYAVWNLIVLLVPAAVLLAKLAQGLSRRG
jgi:hypothetical protein